MRLEQTTYPNYCTLIRGGNKKVFFSTATQKAPGLDGFSADFYHNLWDVIKLHLLDLLSFMHDRFLLKFCEIILLPKKQSRKDPTTSARMYF
jgi:hypothetical protein